MKYFFSTPVIDAQILEIKAKIKLSMNGIVADQLTNSGIIYKMNYGVSLPRIKEIAASYPKNHNLAQQLWALSIRETMIMATFLEQPSEFTVENANDWVTQFNHIEIIEQTCMHLFCKLSFANDLSCQWLQSDNNWTQITGFILSARIYKQLNSQELEFILKKGIELSTTSNLHLYKAIGLCLSRLCRISKEAATFISKEIEHNLTTDTLSCSYILEEVKQELLFLDIL